MATVPRTIAEILRVRAVERPDAVAYRFLAADGGDARTRTYAEMDARARAIAGFLAARRLRGQPVLLLHPPGMEFLEAFFGCLYAGALAVPAFPARANRTLPRLASMAADSGARATLTVAAHVERSREVCRDVAALAALDWIASDAIEDGAARSDAVPQDADAVAYLQYTSGSTSDPKGVMVTHANVLANSETIRRGFRHDAESRSLSWLPHFHDMGLIDGILQPVYSGFPAVLMDPMAFLQSPARWLEAITEHRITHSGGPNFAYELCTRRVAPDPAVLDLASWVVAYNGAEPVRAATLQRFAERFAACGFDRRALHPAYGLAEATLKVSSGVRGDGATLLAVRRAALEAGRVDTAGADADLVGCGRAGDGTIVRIVDAEKRTALDENEVGEIWVGGPSVARGYWNRPEETKATFRARLPGDAATYLRTGDLGFVRAGELFVTGRLKDMIIIRGRNLYPQDVERVAEACSPALRPGGAAAFGVEVGGAERLAVALEVERRAPEDADALLAAIRTAILETCEVDPWAVLLVKPFGVPKTTSGKVQRAACRREFLEGALPVLAEWRAPEAAAGADEPGEADDTADGAVTAGGIRAWLSARIAAKLGVGVDAIALDRPLAAFGLDSLRSMELAHEIERRFGVPVPVTEVLAAPSLAALVEDVEAARADADAATALPGAAVAATPAPELAPGDALECPLSAGQLALYFLHELAPESTAYTIASALRLTGPLDEAALARAVRAVVARHASLRARFVPGPDRVPRQRFDAEAAGVLAHGDAGPLAGAALASRLADEAYRPFDLSRGPLFRASLLRAGADAILLLSAHHAVADLWSLSVVLRDLQRLYAAERLGTDAALPPAPHPAEFVRSQAAWVAGAPGEAAFAFWRDALAGEVEPLELPTNRPRPPGQTFEGAVHRTPLDPALTASLRALARARGVTPYALLLAAFQAFLARVSDCRDVLVGAPAAARTRERWAGLVAYLVNPVVLRGDLRADPAMDELVTETNRRLAAALEHQDFPFATLVQRLAPVRDASRSPFFDVMFELRGTGDVVRGDLAAGGDGRVAFHGGVTGAPEPIDRRYAQFDLAVTVTDDPDRFGLELEYNTALFDALRIEELGDSFRTFLAAAVRDPGTRVSALPLLDAAARDQALGPPPAVGAAESLPGLVARFAAQVARRPDAVAAIHGDARITYAELDRRASRLATRLRSRGVGPDVAVAASLAKGIDLVVALLAILEAGGTFVPIDPALPRERRRFLAKDAGVALAVADTYDATDLGVRVLTPTGAAADGETRVRVTAPLPSSLAYVIHTSGTTGTPKGVGVTHANLAAAIEAWHRAYDLGAISTWLQMAAPGFDVFLADVARALTSGAALVLCDRDVLLDPPALADLCRRHGVQAGDFVPATARELARHVAAEGAPLETFRLVIVGSDAWPMADYPLLRAAFGEGARILNAYGITETTIDNTLDAIPPADRTRVAPALGDPLAHTAAYVLDARLSPVPNGVRGELYLGGPAVARGYVGRPDHTAERFVPDPFGTPGARMYRTGDLARRLSDGRLDFLGRADAQVKIRGTRIEPAEIEAVLGTHPGVRDAAVTAREGGGGRQLVAYVVYGESGGDTADLRGFLAERLPEAWIPAAFVVMPALPRTASGKVDRRALPAPAWDGGGTTGMPPAGPTEERLAEVWRGVLGVEHVGREDDFFALGGDSIVAIRLVARAREAGLSLSPRMLFEHPTLAALARAAEAAGRSAPVWGAAHGDVPLLPIQHAFLARVDGGWNWKRWNLAIALDARDALVPAAVEAAARAVLHHHDALRARFVRAGDGAWQQRVDAPADGAPIAEFAAAAGEPGEAAVSRAADALHAALDPEAGRVAAFGTVQHADGRSTLLIVAHHLVVDGVSLRILADDFDRAYAQARRGERVALPPRTAPAGAWAAALERAVRGRSVVELEHAAERIERAPRRPLPRKPTTGTPGEGTGGACTLECGPEDTARLLAAPAAGRGSAETLLLAALGCGLHAWAGHDAMLVEVESHGRDALDLDVSRTVGWFTRTRVVSVEGLDAARPGATRRAVIRGLERADADLDAARALAADAALRARLAAAPSPEILFNYLGRFDSPADAASAFVHLREPAAPARAADAPRTHALEIDAVVLDGRLSVRLSFSRAEFDADDLRPLLDGVRAALAQLAPADSAEFEDVLPPTPMQEGMLFHHQRGETDPYVAQIALELSGATDLDALARAWQVAADAHAALRTEFAWDEDDAPFQRVRRTTVLPVERHEAVAPAEIATLMDRARAGGFDVSAAPLARVDLARTGADTVTAIFTHHHLLLDGWSLPIVLETVLAAYEDLAAGRPPAPRRTRASREYAAWRAGRDPRAAERHFRAALADFTTPTPPPAAVASADAGTGVVTVVAPADLAERARALGITPSTAVQAAWALVLAAGAGTRDVVFGTTSSGRPADVAGMEGAVGLFINTLPMRARIDPGMTARAWMQALQREGAAARAFEYASLADVQRCAGVDAHTALFDTLLVFENYPMDVAALRNRGALRITDARLHEETNYALTIVTSAEDGVRIRAIHDRARYDTAAARRVLERLTTALEGLLSAPNEPVGRIPTMPPGEHACVTSAWNDTARDYARDGSIPRIFAEVVRAHADDVAVAWDGGQWTYAELDARSARIARGLRARGVGREASVALAMDRSPAFVAAALGVLRAGAAYVPLDPQSPAARRARMRADSRVALAIAGDGAAGDDGAVSLDALLAAAPDADHATLPDVPPDALAYTIFTSGSTGEPKGIEVAHRSIVNLVRAGDYVRFGPGETILHLSTVAFDASTFEIFGALLHGGRLVVAPPGALSAGEITALLERHAVTTVFLTTGLFHVLADEASEVIGRVPQVIFGGDVCAPASVRRVLDAGCRRLVHAYGPTETTTFAACAVLAPEDARGERVPIGRAIANARAYVLDEQLLPAPIGAPGELCIGGDGVARSYASRPDLTAERFIPDPFGPAGSRLYRTGDIVRWRTDGRLEFVGRRDGQVKIRGFRIEPGEVEAALAALPGVRAAAVTVAGVRGAAELVGYFVPAAALDAPAVRHALAARLPAYMIPARLIPLDELPLTPNGKVDRRALPARDPGAPRRAATAGFETPLQESIAAIWRDVLDTDVPGPDDDFFALGGHSLHATRAIARLRRTLGVDLPLRALFDAPTVRGLARRVEAARRGDLAPIGRAPETERRQASFAQRRLWFLDRLEPDSAAYNVAGALRLDGALDAQALQQALTEIVARHEALRTVFAEGADGPEQIVQPAAPVDLPCEDLGAVPAARREEAAARRVAELAREPFDLARGPVLRARLLRLAPQAHVLSLTVHHIAADGWSLGILVDELAAAYAALARGATPALPALPVQYADWAAWQRAWLAGAEMERQVTYWRTQLDALPPLGLPSDRPRPARPTYAGGSLNVALEAALVERLERVSRTEGTTLFMTLLAAFAAVLGRWSGQADFGIGTPVANRTREEAERLIGFFVNSLVVRARLDGTSLPYRDLLARVRDATLNAYAHQDVPFERIVETVAPDRDLSRTPLFQVMFILQNAPMGRLDLGDVRIRPFDAPIDKSTYDLTVSLEPPSARPFDGDDAAPARPRGITGAIEYSAELFDESTIRRLWDHFVRMLDAVSRDPEQDVRRVRLLSAEERTRVLDEWSGRADLVMPRLLMPERFAEAARAHPERVAAVHGGRRVTYAELEARAERLAAHLEALGVGTEDRVGVCLPRSPELLVAILAAWKVGAAYVPLDPEHPRDRVTYALRDAGARVVLVPSGVEPFLAREEAAAVVLDAEDSWSAAASGDADVAPADRSSAEGPGARRPGGTPGRSPERLAYVIYTSGTTGRPKGVMIPHGALAAAYEAWERLYPLRDVRRHLQMANVAFDVCTGDIVRALGSGGTLVFCDRETLLDPAALFALARREAVEFAEFVPAVLRPLAAHARRIGERLESFRTVAVGSDVWSTAEIREFRALFGEATKLANSYGVTEATIDSTCAFVEEGAAAGASPPIGRPLAHATVYVLDDALEPAPPGVLGELYLGGPQVARGYAGRPDWTADRFVPDPFGPPGSRLYRTGDRARYLADGRIVFAGRGDDQVKVRGQRVELAEIEAALGGLDAVGTCAVVVKGEGAAARLAAYVVPPSGAAFDPEGARRRLRERLPESWIPSAFVVLDALPLTPNGKVDRRRLPEPAWSAQEEYEPPRAGAEAAVAAAFAEVLGAERVGAADDFFALGGHSLLAVQVTSRLRAALGVDVPVRMLFEAPVVRMLAAQLEAAPATAPPPVRPASPDARRPASYAQARLWFLERLEPDTAAYHLPTLLELTGALDAEALERALTGIVRRHEALRTRFAEGPHGPEQIVDEPAPLPLPCVDLSGEPEPARRATLERLAREEARRPFDLAASPLVRATLYRLDDARHALLVTTHHIASDGWSLVVMVRELAALYAAFAGGAASPLPELPVQYADWSAWQRAWLEGTEMARQLAWWREALSGLETLALPGDRPRPAHPQHTGDSLDLRFGAALRARLETLARAEGATLHMVLLAGYAAALGRWSGQRRFAVGTPVANRRTAEAEGLIGFFVNTLAIPVAPDPALTFREVVRSVRRSALGAHSNQDVPFERVVEAVDPERHAGHQPLFQVLFALQNVPVREIALPGLSLGYSEPGTGATRFDLELFLAETERLETAIPGASGAESGGLEGLLHYSTELFDRGTIERFAADLEALLQNAVAAPDARLSDLPAMAPRALHMVLREWAVDGEAVAAAPPASARSALVHEPFERVARERPDAVAARFGDAAITYGALEARAAQLAAALTARGIGAEDVVAVGAERSFDLLVAVLAAVKAGAAYVPIDPAYPADRIALLLADSGARVLLTQRAVADRFAATADGTEILLLDAEPPAPPAAPSPVPARAATTDSPVFLVYTSGSTGVPKGVAMTHRALGNLLAWQMRDTAAPRRTLQFAALSFDVSFQEIFSTLNAGGELVLVGEDERRDPPALLRLIERAQVERLFLPFVALHQLAEAARAEGIRPASLREIDTAGEQVKVTPAIAEFFARLPQCRLVNQYGPAETHVVTRHELTGDPAVWPALPPIGRPIPGAAVYVLDAALRPVPIGAAGELCVGGVAPARGYHRRPALTAERFVPDPFSGTAGARLYRTGDVVRYRADGVLEFLGRRDLQIKIRGYRVEPGEIEAELSRHPSVRHAAVRAFDTASGRRLAAFVTARDGARLVAEELRAHVARSLPEYMVPGAIVAMESLPVSPNGKVDREKLPEPDWGAAAGSAAPRTPMEEIVCGIFADVLGAHAVGRADDFFRLGGHSLLATQVVSRIRRAFAVELPLRALFESPTPAGLAAAVAAVQGGQAPLPPIGRAADEARRELSFAQRRLWFLDRLEPDAATYNIPAAVRLKGPLDADALARALGGIVRRHETLRTRFPEGPKGPEQVASADAVVRLVVEMSDDAGGGAVSAHEWAVRVLAEEAARPFDLVHGPVLRARLLRTAPDEHVLSLVVHHIAADGWSLRILWRELAELYAAEVEGREVPLPALAVQYADWAAWQREWLTGGELDRQLAFWRQTLDGAPPALELPTDRARPAKATWNGATLPVHWPARLGERLEALARAEGATLHMVLLAAYAWTLLRSAGQPEVVIGTPVANRRTEEAEALIGFFVNTLPVRIRGDARGLTFRQLVAQVREASLGAYANQDVPFERIVEEIQPERSLNRAPIFQTAFALQDLELPEQDAGGLRMTPFDTENHTAKFDLMLLLGRSGDALAGAFEYNTDLFDRGTMERLGRRLGTVLSWAAESPDTPLGEAPLLDAEETARLARWSRGVTHEWDAPRFVHERFARHAAAAPEDAAVVAPGTALSYGELDARANRLAHHLRALGAAPDKRVAMVLERGPEAVAALLGILKSGAAYLPLDPADPAERVAWVLEDAGAALVVTESRFAERVPAAAARVVTLDGDAEAIARQPGDAAPDVALHEANLAYVIYTSGSTGRPKGVGIEHRQLANYTRAVIERLGIEGGWRFAWISTVAADLGNTALFPALTTGGSLLAVPAEFALDAAALQKLFAEHGVDALKIVPSHLAALVAVGNAAELLPRRLLVLGGEATSGALYATLRRHAPDCRIANHYGPTEATVGSVAGVPDAADAARASLPLGEPLANTQAYVLDDGGGLAPAGVAGEVFLAGAGVARGYLGRPELTAERFVPDPFGEPGARMYRTGDLARWLPDGRLEFLGRRDAQVKVRGFRVELGEIEAAIAKHPDVAACAVIAREDAAGGKSLVAYVAPRPAAAPTVLGQSRRVLPSGLAMAELNRNETDYLHREVVELAAYFRHGVTLRDGDVVWDVGANVGFFSSYAGLAAKGTRLFVFEPNPVLTPKLAANLAAYAPGAVRFDYGLAEREREAEFTFFPGFSLLSGLYADAATEQSVVRSFLENQARAGVEGAEALSREADALLAERFRGRKMAVRLRALSDVLAETGVERIHLLKINVEKAELDVLRGIREEDWARVDQAVVEVDVKESLEPIVGMFEGHGFDVHVEQDVLLERTELCYVYAVRRGSGRELVVGAGPSVALPKPAAVLTAEALREGLGRELPGAMLPAAWVLLEQLPVTANGKLDRRRLPAPEAAAEKYEAPRGAIEETIAGIWSEVLGREPVGVHDNFFDLGGHSLLLVRVHARLKEALRADLGVVELFRYPTVAALAERVARGVGDGGRTQAAGAHESRTRGVDRREALRTRGLRRGRG